MQNKADDKGGGGKRNKGGTNQTKQESLHHGWNEIIIKLVNLDHFIDTCKDQKIEVFNQGILLKFKGAEKTKFIEKYIYLLLKDCSRLKALRVPFKAKTRNCQRVLSFTNMATPLHSTGKG